MRIIISGGGTGGHIFPAIAIANALKKQLPDSTILFVGAKGRMEMTLVPKAGYKIESLPIAGIQRQMTFKNICRNLLLPFKLMFSWIKARRIIRQFKADVAIGVGGYASSIVMKIAAKKHIPTLIQEQNSFPGVTNKILSKDVDKICVAYDSLDKYFPAEKIVFTGNPIRQIFENIATQKEEATKYFDLKADKQTILIVGGSLGARSINLAVLENIDKLQQEDVQIIWQTGKNFDRESLNSLQISDNVRILPFIDRMDLAYSLTDIIVSRAGAIAISELCVVGKPCILVPSPNVAEDHQTKNAMALVNKNAAAMLTDKDIKIALYSALTNIINNKELQQELSGNIKKLAISDADKRIADIAIGLTTMNNE